MATKSIKTVPDDDIMVELQILGYRIKTRIFNMKVSDYTIENLTSLSCLSSRVTRLSRELLRRKYAGTSVKKAEK